MLRQRKLGKLKAMSAVETEDERRARAVAEIDESMIDWYLQLSVIERLRAVASRGAAVLERLARAASTDR